MTKAATKEPTKTADRPISEAVAEAMANVEKLARQEIERYELLPIKKQELDSARNAQDFERAKAIREEVDWLADPKTGREERREAIVKLHLLQAQDLEERAAELQKEVEARRLTAKAFIQQFSDLEHADLEIRTRYYSDRTATDQMYAEARRMEGQAAHLRRLSKHGDVTQEGRVSGTTAQELVEALMKMPENIGPTVAAIYEAVGKRSGKREPGQRLQLVWANSTILECDWHGIIIGERLRAPAQSVY